MKNIMSATQVLTLFGLDPALPRDDGVLESVTLSHNFVIEFSNFAGMTEKETGVSQHSRHSA